MKERSSFLSKLLKFRFFRRRKKAASPENSPDSSGPRPAPKPLKLAESQRTPNYVQPDPYLLRVPSEHALQELWRLRRDQAGWMPQPELRLFDPGRETQFFTPAGAHSELGRLETALNLSAAARLKAALPPPPGPNQEEQAEPPQINLDASAMVFVAGDALSAWIMAYPPVGQGKEISQAALVGALNAAGVSFGLNDELLAAVPTMENRYFHLFLGAVGQPAAPGADGRIEDLFPRVASKELPVDEYNRVDYTAVARTQNVNKDDVICHIIPPTPGIPGHTVTGKEIPTRDGVSAAPPIGRNTALSEDGASLIATRTGGLEFSAKAFQVNPLMEISGNVDYSTGNVNFLGDVHIHGDICSGFTVRAMGNITVDGVVEACTIEAGGDLVLAKGVQGNNQAVIRAHRDIVAKYLENCSVHAQENLHSECIIGCDVYSNAAVYAQTGRGAIIGGEIRAAREVGANIVGSKTEVRTTITLGGLPCEDYQKALITQEIADLEQELKEAERQPESPNKFSRMSKMRMQISVNKLKLNQYNKALEEHQGHQEHQFSGRLTFNVAYPGTWVWINNAQLKIAQETHHSVALLIGDEVKLMV